MRESDKPPPPPPPFPERFGLYEATGIRYICMVLSGLLSVRYIYTDYFFFDGYRYSLRGRGWCVLGGGGGGIMGCGYVYGV
ncbi:hypothetical protein BGX38DRAFT_560761 [Terfezia claveryi]|nr:hypothetical protein BGX38DRAFT_560761 [Terfezia claveryi]